MLALVPRSPWRALQRRSKALDTETELVTAHDSLGQDFRASKKSTCCSPDDVKTTVKGGREGKASVDRGMVADHAKGAAESCVDVDVVVVVAVKREEAYSDLLADRDRSKMHFDVASVQDLRIHPSAVHLARNSSVEHSIVHQKGVVAVLDR